MLHLREVGSVIKAYTVKPQMVAIVNKPDHKNKHRIAIFVKKKTHQSW